MNEGLKAEQPESVYWINAHEPLTRKQQLKKWLFKIAGQGNYDPNRSIPFTTTIPTTEIATLPSEILRDALTRQANNVQNNDSHLTIPLASRSADEVKIIYYIPREPIEL